MLDKRYQVFVISSGLDLQHERVALFQALMNIGFFPWGLEQRTPQSNAIARRQIEECDYVILLLGAEYGELSVAGVSYMHLEYIYAVAKQKPVIVFIDLKSATAEQLSCDIQNYRKIQDFIVQLKHENAHVIYFKDVKDLEQLVRFNMMKMLEYFPSEGWVRPKREQQLQDEIQRLKTELLQAKTEIGIVRYSKSHQQDPLLASKNLWNTCFTFEYKMHAYLDGNFKEIYSKRQIEFGELLVLLSETFIRPASEEHFAQTINHFLNETALSDAREQIPRAHAVSRAQINLNDLQVLKQQFQSIGWIVPIAKDDRQRVLWKIAENGLIALQYCQETSKVSNQINQK